MKIYLITFITLLVINIQAQTVSQDPAYVDAVTKGMAFFEEGDCESCLEEYAKAFEIATKSHYSLTLASACAYQCERPDLMDQYLKKASELSYELEQFFDYNPTLGKLKDSDFHKIVSLQCETIMKDSGLDIALIQELREIQMTDQKWRQMMRETTEEFGQESDEMKALWKEQSFADSVNLSKISAILDKDGYPGISKVGQRLSGTAFLVIQHAPHEAQEKYFDILKEAADKDELSWSSFALLVDRISLKRGEMQTYGSQVISDEEGNPIFAPIKDESNVNKRRAEVGLGPLEDYAKHFGIEYKLPNSKEN